MNEEEEPDRSQKRNGPTHQWVYEATQRVEHPLPWATEQLRSDCVRVSVLQKWSVQTLADIEPETSLCGLHLNQFGMEPELAQFIRVYDLSAKDCHQLDKSLAKLEDDFKSSALHTNGADSFRLLWRCLAAEGLKRKNIRLVATSLRKLELTPLEKLIRIVVRPELDESYDLLFAYIANYFDCKPDEFVDITIESINATRPKLSNQNLDYQFNENLKFLVNSNAWVEAIRYNESRVGEIAISDEHKQILLRPLFYEYAQQLESDDDFDAALSYHEKCGTNTIHAPRLIIKQYMESSYSHLENYCTQNGLEKFWYKFKSCLCLNKKSNHISAPLSSASKPIVGASSDNGDNDLKRDEKLLEDVHDKLINSYGPRDWLNIRQTNLEVNKLSLELSCTGLGRLVGSILPTSDSMKLSNMYLFLNQPEAFLYHSSEKVATYTGLDLADKHGGRYESAACLIRKLTFEGHKKTDLSSCEDMAPSSLRIMFRTYVKLGLFDEALTTLSMHEFEDADSELSELVKRLESNQFECNDVDPRIQTSTMSDYRKFMDANETLITDSITILVNLLGVFVSKLESSIMESQSDDGERLDSMFKYTAKVLDDLTFSYSESLLSATNVLIREVKDKLDLISDNEVIRESFRLVIESIASRCMIESRYKSATMLYSQIEDHVKAVKSLMRTGEVETVINYSLLVRDVTVNRITINYLKHLQVEAHVIDDFIEQCNA